MHESPFTILNGLWIKSYNLERGKIVQQHTHEWPHVTTVLSGSVVVWKHINGKYVGPNYYKAPIAINIPASEPHEFMALEDDTIILCVHNLGNGADAEELNAIRT